jgi:hypothetical protein
MGVYLCLNFGVKIRPSLRERSPPRWWDAVPEFAQRLGCQIGERIFVLFDIAEPRPFHLPSGGAESFRTHVVHINEAECLGKWYPISSTAPKLVERSDFLKILGVQ